MVEEIRSGEHLLAILLRARYRGPEGIEFFTPPEFSQQLAYMRRPAGHVISPHVHNSVSREIEYTKETLIIRSGRVRIDFFSDDRDYLESMILEAGDIVLLAYGGHGFEMLEPSEIVEIKQGPYAGDSDKTRFEPVAATRIRMRSAA